jgi:hypothetical protein
MTTSSPKPISVPNVFANKPDPWSLTQLDADFTKMANSINDPINCSNYGVDTGSADAYAVNIPSAPSSYTDGLQIQFKAATSNTGMGSTVINVNSLGVVHIVYMNNAELPASVIVAGGIFSLIYSSALGKFQVMNPVIPIEAVLGGVPFQGIINGGFNYWQRGTSFSITGTALTQTADLWANHFGAGGAGTVQIGLNTVNSVISQSPYSMVIIQTSAIATTNPIAEYRMEGYQTLAGTTVTLQCQMAYDPGSGSGSIAVQFVQHGDNGVTTTTNVGTISNVLGGYSPYVRYVTFTVPPVTTGTEGPTAYCAIRFLFPTNKAFTLTLTMVKLDLWTMPLAWAQAIPSLELMNVQRHYQLGSLITGFATTNTGVYLQTYPYSTPMRIPPVVTATAVSATGFANATGTIVSAYNGFSETRTATATVVNGAWNTSFTAYAGLF